MLVKISEKEDRRTTMCTRDPDLHKRKYRTSNFFVPLVLPKPLGVNNPAKNLRPKPTCRLVFVFPGSRFSFC